MLEKKKTNFILKFNRSLREKVRWWAVAGRRVCKTMLGGDDRRGCWP